MKRFLLSLIATALCLVATPVWADTVSEEDAAAIAANFFSAQTNASANSQLRKATKKSAPTLQKVKVESVAEDNSDNLFAVYQNEDGEGWVMVSLIDAAHPVLAYSDEGTFSTENMPSNLRGWLKGYNEELRVAKELNLEATDEIAQEWSLIRKASYNESTMGEKVVDYLIQTKWDQTEPFNNLCPGSGTYGSGSTKAATGCVATAMSQVMYFWQWPETGQGSKSYQPKDVNSGNTSTKYGTQSADFANTTYNWANMKTSYTGSYTSAQATAVATLMYHAGVSVEMMYGDYSDGGSGAYTEALNYGDNYVCAQNALWKYFKYNYDSIASYKRSNYSDNNWHNLLKKELDKHRPIMYSGSGTGGGHSFICDGYTANNYFHFNWGWSGSSDGWFLSNALTLSSGGAGSAGLNFNSGQGIIIGIVPNVSSKYTITYNAGAHATCATPSWTQTSIGQSTTLPSATPADKYLFKGWSYTENSRTVDAGVAGDSFTPMRNLTLYAVTPQDGYVLRFLDHSLLYTDGDTVQWNWHGTCEVDSLIEEGTGTGITLPSASADPGWTFQFWAYISGGSVYIAGYPGDVVYPSSNMYLYGYWTEDSKQYVYMDLTGVDIVSSPLEEGYIGGWVPQADGFTATFQAAENYAALTAANTTVTVEIGGEAITGVTSFSNGILTITLTSEQMIDEVDITIVATEDFSNCSNYSYTYATAGVGTGTRTLGSYSWTINAAGSTSTSYNSNACRFGGKTTRTTSVTYTTSNTANCVIYSVSVNAWATTTGSTLEVFINDSTLGSLSMTTSSATYTFYNTNNFKGNLKFVITNAATNNQQQYLYVKAINITMADHPDGSMDPIKISRNYLGGGYYDYNEGEGTPLMVWQLALWNYTFTQGTPTAYADYYGYIFLIPCNTTTSIVGTHNAYLEATYSAQTSGFVAYGENISLEITYKSKGTGNYSSYYIYHVTASWTDEDTGQAYYIDDDVYTELYNYDDDSEDPITPTGDTNPRYYKANYYQQDTEGNTYTLKESATGTGASGETVTAARNYYTGFVTPSSQTVTLADGNTSTNPAVVNYYYDRRTYPISWVVNQLVVQRDTVRYKATPAFNGSDPVRQATEEYTFSFSGWSPLVAPISQANTYTAQFAANVRQYTIVFKDADGNVLQSSAVNYGETPVYSGSTPTKTPTAQYTYVFSGWSPEIEAVSGDAEYVAQFSETIRQYTISFNANGHGTAPESQVLNYGAAVVEPDAPTATGWTFGGWFQEAACTNQWIFGTYYVVEDVELFAKWTQNSWALTWNANGGVLSGEYTNGQVLYGAAITAPTATRTGYDFAGWDNPVPATMPDNALSFTAQWTIHTYSNLTFTSEDENKGTVSVTGEKAEYQYGDQVTITATANDGYTFTGWSDGNNQNPRTITIDDNTTSLEAQFIANTNTPYVVRHWQQNIADDNYTEVEADRQNLTGTTAELTAAAAKTYTGFNALSFSQETIAGNGSTVVNIYYDRQLFAVAFVVDGSTVQSENLKYGATPVAPANPTKDADAQFTYIFNGWTPAISTVTAAATYQATWRTTTNTYTISFNANGHGTAPASQTLAYGSKVVKPADLSVEGYTFGGWFKEESCSNAWDFNNETVIGAQTLFAKWTVNTWTLTWNVNGGTITSAAGTYTNGQVDFGTAIVAPVVEKEGYTLTWNPAVPATMPDANLTINAVWTAKGDIPYQVVHRKQALDGSWVVAETENLTGAADAAIAPAVRNYDGFTSPDIQNTTIAAAGTTVVTYDYTRNSYTLIWDADGGVIADNGYTRGSVLFEAAIIAPADPTKTGSTFHGWDNTIPATMPYRNLTIKAQWTLNTYDGVNFESGNGGSISVNPEQSSYSYGQQVEISATADAGYEFTGWVDENGNEVSSNASTTVTIEGNTTITAQFAAKTNTAYKVQHLQEQLDGSYTVVATDDKTGTTAQLTEAAANSYVGFTAQAVEQLAIAGNGSTVVEIRYTRNSYQLTWNGNGGIVIGGTSGSVKYEAPISEPTSVTWTGHTFNGWDKAVPATMPAEDVTLIAQWTINSYDNIEFKSEDENKGTVSVNPDKDSYEYGETVNISAEANEGYTFTGWSDGSNEAERTITIDENTGVVVAQFTANTNTPYVVRHLIENVDDDEFTLNEELNLTGTTDSEITPEVKNLGEGFNLPEAQTVKILGNGSLVVEYRYTRKHFNLSWDVNGGDALAGDFSQGDMKFGVIILKPADPTWEGHNFLGWDTEVPATMPASDLNVKALWEMQTFVIRFFNFDNELLDEQEVEYGVVPEYAGETPVRPENDEYTYTFIGWDKEIVAATEDAVYTAQFEEIRKTPTGFEVLVSGSTILSDGNIRIYDFTGKDVTGLNGRLSRGAYIISNGTQAVKVMIP